MATFTPAQLSGHTVSITCPGPSYLVVVTDVNSGQTIDNVTGFEATWDGTYPLMATLTLTGGSLSVDVYDLFTSASLTSVTSA